MAYPICTPNRRKHSQPQMPWTGFLCALHTRYICFAAMTPLNPPPNLGGGGWMAPPDSFSWLRATFLWWTSDFLHSLPSNFFIQGLQVASFYDLSLPSYGLVLSQGHVTVCLMQMVTVVDLFSCFFTSMINLAIHDNSNACSNGSSTTAEWWPPYRSYGIIMYDVITGHKKNIFVNNSSQNRDRVVGEVSLCLSLRDASNVMQYDLPGSFISSGHLTWPKVKFSNRPFGVKIYLFRCVLMRWIRWYFAFFSIFLVQKLFAKNLIFPKKQHFLFDLPWEGQNVT